MKNFFTALFSFLKKTPADPAVPLNSGVSSTPIIQPSDWVRGKETGIVESIRNTSGDWRPFLSPGKWQRDMRTLLDTDACMSFSPVDCIEAQLNFMNKYGLISDANLTWLKVNGYFGPDGLANLSPRFTAKLSGTTTNGNNYQNVWGSLRNDGVVPEAVWPSDFADFKGTANDWNLYYAPVSPEAIALGLEFKKRFTIQYEYVDDKGYDIGDPTLQSALLLAPLDIVTKVCAPWNTADIIQGCGIGTQHSTTLTFIDLVARYIRDHYEPFDKRFAKNYAIPYAVRGVLTEVIVPTVPVHFSHTFTTPYKLGDTATEIILIQNLLKIQGCMPTTVVSTGYFGNITALANGKFQAKFGISPVPNNIGPKTLALLNQAMQG